MARISNYGSDAPQSDSAVSAIRNNSGVAAQHDPVKMLQYVKDAGTRNVESMGQIGASWFDGIPQVYDDDQIAAAKSAISRAQTPEEVYQIILGLTRQNHGGNVGPINNALGQMGVGYSSNVGLSDIGRSVRSMTGTLDRVDVPAEDDYERALQWLGNAIPNVAAISDFAIPLPSGVASTVHLYKGAKALPGKVAGGVKAAPGKVADWYKGRYNAYSDRLAGKKPAAPAETAAPAAERTAASETAAPAAERTAASETAADDGVSELANAGNAGREAAAGGQAAGREAAAAGEQAAGREAAADGGVSELANAGNAGREAAAAGREAAAAGREAAAADRAGEAAGTAARQGEGKAAGALSNYDRQQYRAYINFVQNDSGFADLVSPTLNRVVGSGRSIDSLSDAELSAFYKALSEATKERWIAFLNGANK